MFLTKKYLNVFVVDLLRESLLQKGRCGKYEKDREQENESKREQRENIFYDLQKDPGSEPIADDHRMCVGGNSGIPGTGSGN